MAIRNRSNSRRLPSVTCRWIGDTRNPRGLAGWLYHWDGVHNPLDDVVLIDPKVNVPDNSPVRPRTGGCPSRMKVAKEVLAALFVENIRGLLIDPDTGNP